MKNLSFALVALCFTSLALGASWPASLTDLNDNQQTELTEAFARRGYSRVDYSRYTLSSYQPTVGSHGIANYSRVSAPYDCYAYGRHSVVTDTSVITLYVNDETVKDATQYAVYGCHED